MKVREHNDAYYYKKYNLTEEQLTELKEKRAKIEDPDLIIEDLIEKEPVLGLSTAQKIVYLKALRKNIVKILYLIEEEAKDPTISAYNFIVSLLLDLSSANLLFNNQLTEIYVKIVGVGNEYRSKPYDIIRKQVLDARGLVDKVLSELSGNNK